MQESTSPVKSSPIYSVFTDSVGITHVLLVENQATNRVVEKPFDTNELFSVPTYNKSAWGYSISWQSAVLPKIRVGDVLAIRLDKTPGEYSLGIIRWLNYSQEEKDI